MKLRRLTAEGAIPPIELLVATHNEGKIAELGEAFATLPVRLRLLREFGNISQVAEVGETYLENATLKAKGYSHQTGITALADDSGLEVDALRGGPGVFSARFGGEHLSDRERTEALLMSLQKIGPATRRARFICCMVLYGSLPSRQAESSPPQVLAITEGICEGSLALEPSGGHGFGFDPVFIPNGYELPFAALDQAIKRKLSHRALAAQRMRQQLEFYLDPNLTAGRSAS